METYNITEMMKALEDKHDRKLRKYLRRNFISFGTEDFLKFVKK